MTKIIMSKLIFVSAICIILFSACADRESEEIKIELELEFGQSLQSLLAVNDDSLLNNILDTAIIKTNSTEQFVNSVFENYKKHGGTLKKFRQSNDGIDKLDDAQWQREVTTQLQQRIERFKSVLFERIESFGKLPKTEIKIVEQGNKLIVVVKGNLDKKVLLNALKYRDGVRFWACYDALEIFDYISTINTYWAEQLKDKEKRNIVEVNSEEKSLDELVSERKFDNPLFKIMLIPNAQGIAQSHPGGPLIGMVDTKDTQKISKILNCSFSKNLLPENLKFIWGNHPYPSQNKEQNMYVGLYAINSSNQSNGALIDGRDIEKASIGDKENSSNLISIDMNNRGAKKWEQATRNNINRAIIIEVDNFVLSAPNVISEITGGKSSITGSFTKEEAETLALCINAGVFPMNFKIVEP